MQLSEKASWFIKKRENELFGKFDSIHTKYNLFFTVTIEGTKFYVSKLLTAAEYNLFVNKDVQYLAFLKEGITQAVLRQYQLKIEVECNEIVIE